MPEYKICCLYCNHSYEDYFYNNSQIEDLKCPKCRDKNLKITEKSLSRSDVFGYTYEPGQKNWRKS